MNRIGINLWNWTPEFNNEHIGLIDRAAGIGFTAVEIGMVNTRFDFKAVREKIEEYGLELSLCGAFVKGRDISNFDADIRKNTKTYMTDCFKAAEKMGSRLFVGPVYAGGGKAHALSPEDRKREWELAVEGLKEMADVASQCGVTIGLEPIQRYRTSVVNTVDQALRMIAEIDKPNVGLHFDTYQANIEEASVCDALEKACKAGKLVHFHSCENNRGAPGMGHLPWKDLVALLKKYGYGGHITMETFVIGGMDSGWVLLAPTQDALAESGFAYLKKILE